MDKYEYFVAACQNKLYAKRAWVVSVFSMIAEAPDNWKKDPYPYRLVQSVTGFMYVNPKDVTELLPITGLKPEDFTRPLYRVTDSLTLKAGALINLNEDIKTVIGNALFNYAVVAHAFGAKIPYLNDRISPGKLLSIIKPRLVENDPDGKEYSGPLKTAPITVSEFLSCARAAFYMTNFTQLWVPGETEKSLLPPPGLKEFKDKLYEEYKDRLTDPVAVAEMDAKLVAYDAAYLKGDRSEGFLISGKSRKTVRRKRFLSLGAEQSLKDTVEVDPVKNSLYEGWDITKFDTMNNAQRAGSFNRGAQTMLGGESVKWLQRASSNLAVTKDDCGTKFGYPVMMTESELKRSQGFSVVTPTGHEVLNEETSGKYLGKKVMRRSAAFCRMQGNEFCFVCVGPRIARTPTGVSSAITKIGSVIMQIFLASAHGTNLVLAHMDYNEELE